MGNVISSDVTVDGFPIAPTLRRWGASVASVIRTFLSPVTAVVSILSPPLANQIRDAALLLPSAERRKVIQAIEPGRCEVAAALTRLAEAMARLAAAEAALQQQLDDVEALRVQSAEALEVLEARLAEDAVRACENCDGGGAGAERKSVPAMAEARAALAAKEACLRAFVEEEVPRLSLSVVGQLVVLRAERARLGERLDELRVAARELGSSEAVVRLAEERTKEQAAAESLASAEDGVGSKVGAGDDRGGKTRAGSGYLGSSGVHKSSPMAGLEVRRKYGIGRRRLAESASSSGGKEAKV